MDSTRVRRALAAVATWLFFFVAAATADPQQQVATTCWGTDVGPLATHGQSFTADATGEITAIGMHLQISQPPAGSLILSIHEGGGFNGTQLHSQLVGSPHDLGSVTPIVTYVLHPPVPVTQGQVYTIGIMKTDLGDAAGFCGTEADLYSGGSVYFNGSAFLGADAAFHVTLDPFVSYGSGCVGSGAIAPTLVMSGDAAPGGSIALTIEQGIGGGSSFLLMGTQRVAVPMGHGCSLLASTPSGPLGPFFLGPLTGSGAGSGAITLHGSLPAATPAGAYTFQGFVHDAGVPAGFSNTNGVEMNVE